MEKQYIYIFSISDKPDLIKVGRTSKHPHIRANDLSKNTAATGRFNVEWFMEVPDAELAEKIAHFKLKEHHANKEYFSLKPFDAYLILEKFLIPLFEINKPVITYEGKIKLLIELNKKSKSASKKLKIVLNNSQSEIDEKIEVATKTLKKVDVHEREERIKKLKESTHYFANKESLIVDTNEEERKFQERKKKILQLAKKANKV